MFSGLEKGFDQRKTTRGSTQFGINKGKEVRSGLPTGKERESGGARINARSS